MKFGVVTFPGSNCDQDMIDALRNDLNQEVIHLWHKDNDLSMFTTDDCILLPGGFSYGDYLRCGAIARFSPMMQSVIEFANKGGKVVGVCNGFQILCEAGLLPGVLLQNKNQQFICKNVYIKSENTHASLSKDVTGRPLMIPIAHGEGRYYADDATLEGLIANNQVIFRYCDEFGNIVDNANPNGALHNIAGICNKERNVFGMMPHPERATSSILGNTDGQLIFQSLINNN
ncbi:phosphoribosylformylglycinamidine synthase [Chitinophaga skermanii]|uniref:Phosphoribosylformylglycinamidine synthase subunit PurQ n=1 Tax=Chitinophaga skermanii TaxID=331697 RepID=A0A327QHZ1_9BACT|nr:phosphoribosylformylglycinamidine synthase subunit PurQ [Chitinophaga skermanii]RAJ04226.1 phosphoribosylformylglycinamidine synthase [Chitinophaga skermanii]